MATSANPSRILVLQVTLAAALIGPGCVDIVSADLGRYVEREEKHFTLSGKPTVSLKTFDGSVEVRTWDKAEVLVTIEKRGSSKASTDSIEVRSDQQGNQITVEARVPSSHGFHFNE